MGSPFIIYASAINIPVNLSLPNEKGTRHTPLQIVHVIGNFLRIWSVYSMYRYLSQTGASVVLFIFCCLVPSAIIFIALQKPWKGRPLSNTQVVPSIINGGITALYFILWGKGLKSCGPLRAIMAEYSGAVLGVLSAVLYGRKGHVWKKEKIFCNVAMYLTGEIPFNDDLDTKDLQEEQAVGMNAMIVPILAGILSALRRVIARRVSLKIAYGFLFAKAFNGCWRMHHCPGDSGILGFIHVASNFLATKSCKCLSFDFFLLAPKIGRKEFSSSRVNSSDAQAESLLLDSEHILDCISNRKRSM
ncbi:hypothetical protein RHGRI_028747 [Rhododendron griersonianum]|uniref:Uncharacterized protein n=1 Tax=Rhododendron griersonianum TaxID=479676 RepID=A0AAV6IIX1_9ERIC|nr:hypothetical protein RHGRI_028747 [Rhododendron griersonianum]